MAQMSRDMCPRGWNAENSKIEWKEGVEMLRLLANKGPSSSACGCYYLWIIGMRVVRQVS